LGSGLLNHETKNLQLELVDSRTSEVLKYIIEKHVGFGNIIITEGWIGYTFLGRINSNSRYSHHSYNHGRQ